MVFLESRSIVFISIIQIPLTRNEIRSANLPKHLQDTPSEPTEPTKPTNKGTLPQSLVVHANKLVI